MDISGAGYSLEELERLAQFPGVLLPANKYFAWKFNPAKWAETSAWDELVDEVLVRLSRFGLLVRPQNKKLYQRVCRVILANLLSARDHNERLFIRYSRCEGKSVGFPFRPKIKVIDALLVAGLAEGQMGHLDRSSQTGRESRIRAAQGLADLATGHGASPRDVIEKREPVVLRNKWKREVNVRYNKTALSIAKRVERINSVLAGFEIALDLPAGMSPPTFKNSIPVDTSRRMLCRIFSRNSFKMGGRFYCHWVQSVRSSYREYLVISGEKTVELDYGGCHINMLYAKEGLPAHSDVYAVAGCEFERDVIKIAVQVILNHDKEKSAPGAVVSSVRLAGYEINYKEAAKLLSELKKHHAPIAKYFFKKEGLALQYDDSCVAEAIMLSLLDRGIPVIPVHDSFIVPASQEEVLRATMEEKYLERFGQRPVIK